MADGAPPPPRRAGPPPGEVIALFGPTGVGKTDVAIALADLLRVRGERPVAVSADALQVYQGLSVLTGAADATQRTRLEHRLLSFVPLEQEFSVGEFMPLAHAEVDGAFADGRRPIVVGGTGLYLRAALASLDLRPPPPATLRSGLEAEMQALGNEEMHARLPAEVAGAIAVSDRSRIIRALELAEMGEEPARGSEQLWTSETRHPTLLFGLTMERQALYERIDARVDAMVNGGALEEVQAAAATASKTARKALGFDELLNGDVEGMKRRTRNYAKRQLTWMRKLPNVQVIDTTDRSAVETASVIAKEVP